MDSSSLLSKPLPQWPISRTPISNSIYPALPSEGMDQELPGRSRHHGTLVWFRWCFSRLLWHSFLLEMESSSMQVMGPQAVSLRFFLLSIFHFLFVFSPWWLTGEFYSIIYKCEEGFPSSRVGGGGHFFLVLLSATGRDFFFYGFQSLRWLFHKFDHKTTRIWSGWFFTPKFKKNLWQGLKWSN